MAIVNRDSTAIADMVAVPRVPVNPSKGAEGNLFESAGYVANAADDSGTSVHRFCRVPSNARVSAVLFSTADSTTAGALDIGVYQTLENGGAVVDADFFASAFVLTNGPFSNTDVTHESAEYTFAESMQPLWQALGLTADPQREYDVAGTITTTYNGAGVGQALKVRYVL
jgi:hypothetical protein